MRRVQELMPLEEEDVDAMEDRLEVESPWEIAFEEGEQMASNEIMDDWEEEDEW